MAAPGGKGLRGEAERPVARRRAPKPRGGQDRAVRIRMYRKGLGDCFLLGLPRSSAGDRPFWILIDCGLIVGTSDPEGKIGQILDDVATTTGRSGAKRGRIDLLVVTHEHWDHVSGFVDGAKHFDEIEVGAIWFPWTEDPDDPLAQALRTERERRRDKLAAVASHLGAQGLAAGPLAQGLRTLLESYGADFAAGASKSLPASGGGGRTTAAALANARGLLSTGKPRYCRPSDAPATFPEVPGVRAFVLGPPPDETMLKKTDARGEVFHLGAAAAAAELALHAAVERAADAAGSGPSSPGDAFCPFDGQFGRPLRPYLDAARSRAAVTDSTGTDPLATFLDRHYFGPDAASGSGRDQSWRRIDADWLGLGADLALRLDSATNNTSLVLAFELVESRRVLLFAADAQVGNWLSWHDCAWTLPEGSGTARVTGADLLGRTVFYKVGHHGSHNATLEKKGLDLMTSPDLVAFIPVDQAVAESKGWTKMPLPRLVEALTRKTRGRLLRADRAYKAGAAQDAELSRSGGEIEAFSRNLVENDLYFEWRVAM